MTAGDSLGTFSSVVLAHKCAFHVGGPPGERGPGHSWPLCHPPEAPGSWNTTTRGKHHVHRIPGERTASLFVTLILAWFI